MSPLRNLSALRAGLRRWREDDVEAALAKLNRRHEVEDGLRERIPELRHSLKRWNAERIEDELRALHFRESELDRARFRPALLAIAAAVAVAAAVVLWLVGSRAPNA